MRICLISHVYPPANTEGIARQRHTLATFLASQGHDVHVITLGDHEDDRVENLVSVHVTSDAGLNRSISTRYPGLNASLWRSQAVYERLAELHEDKPLDIVDTPLWGAIGFVTLVKHQGPVIVWLQTTLAKILLLQKQRRTADQAALLGLERECLSRATALLADSYSVLQQIEELYHFSPVSGDCRVVPLGLPDRQVSDSCPYRENLVEALVVGRLETRKGTAILFDILPELLERIPSLHVRFVGQDNSMNDGFHSRTRYSYPDYFRQHNPAVVNRVTFEGYLPDDVLAARYSGADFLLAPSLYESFGLVYLEAMRSGLPVVTMATGAAPEVFPAGEDDGAYVVELGDKQGLVQAIRTLSTSPELRRRMGQRARQRFLEHYQDSRMGKETASFYQDVVKQHVIEKSRSRPKSGLPQILQIMEALAYGDAVSNIAIGNSALLRRLGYSTRILSVHRDARVAGEAESLDRFRLGPDARIIFHYWNYSELERIVRAAPSPRAIHYHNITPPQYFSPSSPVFKSTKRGYEQLARIADMFDLIIGDSTFNLVEYAKFLSQPRPTICVPPVVDKDKTLGLPHDDKLLRVLRDSAQVNFLFVGRLARNKRQDRVMEVFDYYYREINRHARLFLVGDDRGSPDFRDEVENLRQGLAARDRIVFAGKVSTEALYSYYRAADVFVSASEHEGFCVPIVEAMVFGIPVIALAAAAIPETIGDGGILVRGWDSPRVAELINAVLKDRGLQKRLADRQEVSLARYSESAVAERLRAAADFLWRGEDSPLFVWRGPDRAGSQVQAVTAGA